jgi:AGCS family alanine or glycine:cation symporter
LEEDPVLDLLESIVGIGNTLVWSTPTSLPWLVVFLLGTGFFVTLRLGFIQLKQVKHALKVVRGDYDDDAHEGDITHFEALSTALSATVGIGNIAGVATAIHYGGPGALFWMWVTAFFGMALKFAECTLSMHYREFDEEGNASGGPMYYIEKGLGPKWKPLAGFFAVCAVVASFGGGNMNQANTIAVSASTDFGMSVYLVGAISALIVGAVILGGIKRIATVSSRLAPTMAAVYCIAAMVIIAFNFGEIPYAFTTIFHNAFNPAASLGGSVAGIWSVTLLWGVKRGLFSNEAGQGSAPIAHAAAKTDEPVREGVVAMLGPLIDTLIICTMTGLVIVVTGSWDDKVESTVDIDSTIVVFNEHLDKDALTEFDSIKVGIEQFGIAIEKEPVGATRSVQIENGIMASGLFIAREAKVANPIVLHDGEPYTGTLTFDLHERDWLEEGFTVRGGMLLNSSALTAMAFKRGLSPLGDWGNYVVTLCVFLFAISTMISWSYYGDRCVTYLWGTKYVIYYRIIYTGFVFLGSVLALEVVWAFGDLAMGLMTLPNLLAVILLMPKLLEITRDYFERMGEKAT